MTGTVAQLVSRASEGDVTAADAQSGTPLASLGLTSLGYLRLIQLVEEHFGVVLDLDGDASYLDSVPALENHLRATGTAL